MQEMTGELLVYPIELLVESVEASVVFAQTFARLNSPSITRVSSRRCDGEADADLLACAQSLGCGRTWGWQLCDQMCGTVHEGGSSESKENLNGRERYIHARASG